MNLEPQNILLTLLCNFQNIIYLLSPVMSLPELSSQQSSRVLQLQQNSAKQSKLAQNYIKSALQPQNSAIIQPRVSYFSCKFICHVNFCALKSFILPSMMDAKGVIIEGDCKNLIDFCQASVGLGCWGGNTTMAEDLVYLSDFTQVLFNHVPPEANRVADFCARFALILLFVGMRMIVIIRNLLS